MRSGAGGVGAGHVENDAEACGSGLDARERVVDLCQRSSLERRPDVVDHSEAHCLFGVAGAAGEVAGDVVAVPDELTDRDGDGAGVDTAENQPPVNVQAGGQLGRGARG